ncbi:MAG: LacI family DNA-binding transcriptional regulator [Terrimicrobiaceae bacterium]
MSSASRPTLRDVAREAGVSHMTVSRAVRGEHRVSPATRERVEKAVRKLGYRPDPALSALAAYRTRGGGGHGGMLAFLHCDATDFSQLVSEGTRAEAERLGYTLEPHPLPRPAAAQRRLGRILFHRGVRGLLFGPSQSAWRFEGWAWEQFTPISLGALSHQPAMNSVAMDYFDGVMKAASHLRALGARRVGLAVDPALESRTGHRWLGGYAAAQHPSRPIPPYSGNARDHAALRHWCRKNRLDGVLTIHRSVWQALRAQDVKWVFLNAFECPPGGSHVAFDPMKIGMEGVRFLHHQLLNREFGLPAEIKTVTLRGTLVWGRENAGS